MDEISQVPSVSTGEAVFSVDWFAGSIPDWQSCFAHLVGQPNVRYLEIGVYEGRSLSWALQNVLTHPSSLGTGIDLFCVSRQEHVEENLRRLGVSGWARLICGASSEILPTLDRESYDIVFVDGDHSAQGTLSDLVLSWNLIKQNGFMVVDDYSLFSDSHPVEARPQGAIDSFLMCYKNSFDLSLKNSNQVILKKKPFHFYHGMSTDFGNYTFRWPTYATEATLHDHKKGETVQLDPAQMKTLIQILKSRGDKELNFPRQSVPTDDLSSLEACLGYLF